jgi:hypothetical protein
MSNEHFFCIYVYVWWDPLLNMRRRRDDANRHAYIHKADYFRLFMYMWIIPWDEREGQSTCTRTLDICLLCQNEYTSVRIKTIHYHCFYLRSTSRRISFIVVSPCIQRYKPWSCSSIFVIRNVRSWLLIPSIVKILKRSSRTVIIVSRLTISPWSSRIQTI